MHNAQRRHLRASKGQGAAADKSMSQVTGCNSKRTCLSSKVKSEVTELQLDDNRLGDFNISTRTSLDGFDMECDQVLPFTEASKPDRASTEIPADAVDLYDVEASAAAAGNALTAGARDHFLDATVPFTFGGAFAGDIAAADSHYFESIPPILELPSLVHFDHDKQQSLHTEALVPFIPFASVTAIYSKEDHIDDETNAHPYPSTTYRYDIMAEYFTMHPSQLPRDLHPVVKSALEEAVSIINSIVRIHAN